MRSHKLGRRDEGVAGLTILLSLITMLFVIGLLVMVFALMSGQLQTETLSDESASVSNETLTTVTETGESLSVATVQDVACTFGVVTNSTGGQIIASGNYTTSGCTIYATLQATTSGYNNTDWNVSASYTYTANTTATDVIVDTSTAISSSTNFFALFIVITSMVVLVLLTVIIIVAIRGSGLMEGGASSSGSSGLGSA